VVTPPSTQGLPSVVTPRHLRPPPWLLRSALHFHGALVPRCSTVRCARVVVRLSAHLHLFVVWLVPPLDSPSVPALVFSTFRFYSHLLCPRLPLPRRPGPVQTASEVIAPASGTLLGLASAVSASQLVVASAPPATSQRFYPQLPLLSAPAVIGCQLGRRLVRGVLL
jgi:hypothetical protein